MSMWDRYDPRSSNSRDRDDFGDRSRGSRGWSSERDHAADRDPRDVFTKDLDLPRGRERRPVRDRDRVYEINGIESRMLATVGAFRVVSESDLHDGREDTRKSLRHLERQGLIRTSPLSSDDRAVVLTDRGRDLLEVNRYERHDRAALGTGRPHRRTATRVPVLVERGVPLAQVRDLFGHASILTTERYDNQKLEALQAAVERLEGGKTFDPRTGALDRLSRIFQDPTEQSFAESEDPAKESTTSH